MNPDWFTMSHDEKKNFVSKNLDSSASQISAMLKNASRNAVIGFCHRNKLQLGGVQKAQHATNMSKAAIAERARRAAIRAAEREAREAQRELDELARQEEAKLAVPDPEPEPVKVEDPANEPAAVDEDEFVLPPRWDKILHLPVSMLNLTERNCKWPLNVTYVGVPVDKMMFCGKPKDYSGPWCNHHAMVAFGGKYSGGRVQWKDGEGPKEKKIMKRSVFSCRG